MHSIQVDHCKGKCVPFCHGETEGNNIKLLPQFIDLLLCVGTDVRELDALCLEPDFYWA